ncbi:membrane protein insertion efficiency factor YidD [SAR86 cluster bacterium]|nr:membrane protein insertion efficiency factor YidD [SAR86 cluster bacterium]
MLHNLINNLEKYSVNVLLFFINIYKVFISPYLGQNCRYHPTCSTYAKEALQIHGLRKGVALSLKRISKCHPFGGSGVDLVPGKDEPKN